MKRTFYEGGHATRFESWSYGRRRRDNIVVPEAKSFCTSIFLFELACRRKRGGQRETRRTP